MAEITPGEFEQLVLNRTALLDLRSEGEFLAGNLPNSINIPILSDHERAQVGTCYKEAGSAAAMKLGLSLVSGETRSIRIARWKEFFETNPKAALFCWRGGLRSKIALEWLSQAGIETARIVGGFKAFRRFHLSTLERVSFPENLIVVTGRTGSGKTALLHALSNCSLRVIDLEQRAMHRGSSFGRLHLPQPSQVSFENAIASDFTLLGHSLSARFSDSPVFIEDESRMIGRIKVPDQLFRAMKECPLVELRADDDSRVKQIIEDYVLSPLCNAPEGEDRFYYLEQQLRPALARLTQSLGMERFQAIDLELVAALNSHKASNDPSVHQSWILRLLREYYDPVYDRHLERGRDRIIFRGSKEEILEWAKRFL